MPLFYAVATATVKALLASLTRWEVKGRENVPRNGPLIVVSNHLSMVDPPLLSASVPRRIFFMAKEELFSSRGGAFIRWLGAFPVRRGTPDRRAIRQAMQVLERGQTLGMFPEGRRSLNHQMNEAEFGVAMIALRSGVSILPTGICGSENVKWPGFIWRRPRITVTIGQPFSLPRNEGKLTREQLIQATSLIMGHIAEVLPPGYRGIWECRVQGSGVHGWGGEEP
ncbi:MAG: lysophospholipid acyltransferase family protein [Dehalococcoidia bacterium]|nr:1-acyl-sn-glycerol-3-phosphate acyltransferase [Chloroflexota bacterium]MBT9161608.1 1-acyl-sn-glycerol-3-phosphate acyltransferase [Chloroflexota bacterium]